MSRVDDEPAGRSQQVDLESALDHVSDGFLALDRDLGVRYANEAAAVLVGRPVGDLLGRDIRTELPSAVGADFDRRYGEALGSGTEVEFDGYFDRPDTWISIHVYPSPVGATLILRNVTDLRELIKERRVLLDQLLDAEDHERARIASNVHDDSLQALGALHLGLQVLRRYLPTAPPKVEELLTTLDDQVRAATERLRSLLFSLEPTVSDAPISLRIRAQAATVFDGSSTHWSVDDVDGGVELDRAERTQVLRITKEALLNVRAHAQASEVTVTVRGDAEGQEVMIVDNGVGGDPVHFTSAPGHRGLATMQDRAAVMGGTCTIEPFAPRGCTVRLYVPRVPPLVQLRPRPR